MHSELSETADGMNAVRGRAGLDPVSYSIENLKEERLTRVCISRAFVGLTWFAGAMWKTAADNLYGVPVDVVYVRWKLLVSYSVSYRNSYQRFTAYSGIRNPFIERGLPAEPGLVGCEIFNI
jgi:starch-binding outer membrane protein, SusD/RagB family